MAMVMTAYFIEGRTRMSALLTVPRKYNAMVRLRVPREMKRGMNRLAKTRKIAAADLYRQAIEDYLKDQGGVEDATALAARASLGSHTKSA